MSASHQELDRLVHVAEVHGWRVNDSRRDRCVLWFARGREYAHAGVNLAGDLLHAYGGVRGRPNRFWTRDVGSTEDHAELLERAFRAEVFDQLETREWQR